MRIMELCNNDSSNWSSWRKCKSTIEGCDDCICTLSWLGVSFAKVDAGSVSLFKWGSTLIKLNQLKMRGWNSINSISLGKVIAFAAKLLLVSRMNCDRTGMRKTCILSRTCIGLFKKGKLSTALFGSELCYREADGRNSKYEAEWACIRNSIALPLCRIAGKLTPYSSIFCTSCSWLY